MRRLKFPSQEKEAEGRNISHNSQDNQQYDDKRQGGSVKFKNGFAETDIRNKEVQSDGRGYVADA